MNFETVVLLCGPSVTLAPSSFNMIISNLAIFYFIERRVQIEVLILIFYVQTTPLDSRRGYMGGVNFGSGNHRAVV